MKKAGQLVYLQFPQVNLLAGKLRPGLLLTQLPGKHDDWLVCMLSTQLQQFVLDLDEIINPTDADFLQSGLKKASLIRGGRLAVVEDAMLVGAIGEIHQIRLQRVKQRIANWLVGK